MILKIVFMIFMIELALSYIVIEFKTHHSKIINENEKNFNSSDFMIDYRFNKLFFPIEVGSPPKEVPFILNTLTSGLNIGYSICKLYYFSDLPEKYFEYSAENSTTYNLTSQNIKRISNTITGSQSTELFKFYTDIELKESKQILINDLPFIYSSKADANKLHDDGTMCGIIGLVLFERDTFQSNYNLIHTLKQMNITDNYIFNYEYKDKNNDEGMLIIGVMPHVYNPKKYHEEQLKIDYAVAEHFNLIWGVQFNSIYFFDEENNKITMNDIKYGHFTPEIYCIKGTSTYKKLIIEKFFNYYMTKNICRFDKISYEIMNCDINSEFDIKKFPSLFFHHKKFNYTFELNYNDLFLKKGNKYFFMVIFPLSYIEYFEMGKIFLKKYFFSYDVDKKTISFYNENIPLKESEYIKKEKFNYYIYLIIISILVLLISVIIGFYFGKKIYEKTRNKRKNELEEDYDYSTINKG